jgi:hypothetical protein
MADSLFILPLKITLHYGLLYLVLVWKNRPRGRRKKLTGYIFSGNFCWLDENYVQTHIESDNVYFLFHQKPRSRIRVIIIEREQFSLIETTKSATLMINENVSRAWIFISRSCVFSSISFGGIERNEIEGRSWLGSTMNEVYPLVKNERQEFSVYFAGKEQEGKSKDHKR